MENLTSISLVNLFIKLRRGRSKGGEGGGEALMDMSVGSLFDFFIILVRIVSDGKLLLLFS